jgi:CRP-like cAMP-binding protein
VLIRQGDDDDDRVFLLESGSVEVVDLLRDPPKTIRLIDSGHYFGERAALFEEPRGVEIRAAEPSRAYSMSGERFLRLIAESSVFAQALGNILRGKQGIFTPFDRFDTELRRAIARGAIDLGRLLPFYSALEPALHPHLADGDTIDVGALGYAVARLPENLTRTLAFFITETLPELYSEPDSRFELVRTVARRRTVYEMIPGKSMVLLRDGISDLVDFITCLCVYAIEARKIRRMVRVGGGLDSVPDALLDSLRPVWGDESLKRVGEVSLHHEDFRIEIHKELDRYTSTHGERWGDQIATATRELMGHDRTQLPDDVAVHVISSNTHSVTNCLSPWLGLNADTILQWGHDSGHPLAGEDWHTPYDLVCALARDYLSERPEMAQADREAGILGLEWTAFTGIGVGLIDASSISWAHTDPGLRSTSPERPTLIVNIDYAFGEQAQPIIANLVYLFGRNLKSVSVLGKAGDLVGDRGDVLVGTGFVEQHAQHLQPVPGGSRVDVDGMRADLPGRAVYEGNLLTVTGTLLQNRKMLLFNRHMWGCVGLEMEGSYYLGHILDSMNHGIVSPDIDLSFLYYVSDVPLRHDSNLSARLRAGEGIPPLYAITREVLRGILGSD